MSGISQLGKPGGIGGISNENLGGLNKPGKVDGAGFKDALRQVRDQAVGQLKGSGQVENLQGLKFSNHAVDRMRSRGISYGAEKLGKLNQAVEKAAAKGAKETLVLTDDSALIVSVKNNTVVTVMDKSALKDNVFTNIDSTIVI